MSRAHDLFSDEERRAVSAAVAEAERGTSGEIVPVVATVSGSYDRAEDLFGLTLAVVALTVVWLFVQDIDVRSAAWAPQHSLALGLIPVVVTIVVAYFAGAVLATYVPALRRPFIGRHQMSHEVERGAAAAFQKFRVRHTSGGTGILIYVSLYERMVRVIGDEHIGARLAPSDWQAVCDMVIDGLRRGRAAEGLTNAIGKCGELLSHHFPRQTDDRNELSNELRLLD